MPQGYPWPAYHEEVRTGLVRHSTIQPKVKVLFEGFYIREFVVKIINKNIENKMIFTWARHSRGLSFSFRSC